MFAFVLRPLGAITLAVATVAAAPVAQAGTLNGAAPIVIGHRGASGYLPEHTLEGYRLAIAMGADYIEPDLVMTKDGVMIARHEPMLGGTTDVATKFPDRRTTRMVDGVSTTDWFASDFTLAEIKTLRAVQPRAGRDQQYNGQFQIPTLAEVIELAKGAGRRVGIYPEIKHSTYHAGLFGANVFEDKLVAQLHAAYGNRADAPVFIQSFETTNLRYLRGKTTMKLIQLVDADDVNRDGSLSLVAPYAQPYDLVVAGSRTTFADLLTPSGLADIATYANGIGPWKPYLLKTVDDGIDRNGDGVVNINDRRIVGSTGVIEAAHAASLLVHTWTFRNDASGYGFSDPKAEMAHYLAMGVDGFFTDFPDTGVAARAMVVPEPGSVALAAGALVAMLAARRRRAAQAA